MEKSENYVMVRNDRGIPMIVPLNTVDVNLPKYIPLGRAGYGVIKKEDDEVKVYLKETPLSMDAILSISSDAPSIERRHPDDLDTIQRVGTTTVVQYVTPSGEVAWCYQGPKGEWYHAMTDTEKLWREVKVEERRNKERDRMKARWQWAA